MRRWIWAITGLSLVVASPMATAQDTPSPRVDLPFSTEPDRLVGPPRAMGELPLGDSQPPSTLPGRMPGPPRAMGESPPGSPGTGGPFQGPTMPGAGSFNFGRDVPLIAPGSTPTNAPFFFGLNRPGGGDSGDLPLALPDYPGVEPAAEDVPGGIGTGVALSLDEVLSSAVQTYPSFIATLQERSIAGGDLLSAEGAFDLNMNMDSRNYPLGFYRRSVHDVFFDQPLRFMGAEVFTGYRVAEGSWPTYYNYLNTRGGGAFVNGFKMPLMKNREIDARRAKMYQAEIERRKVEPTILKERIKLLKTAAKVYWEWVAAGQAVTVYRDLVRLAETRGDALEIQAREQLVRPIDLVDFRRVVLSRQQQLVAAELRFQRAAIELSLFYRDSMCLPQLPEPPRVPPIFPTIPPPDPSTITQDLDVALRLRPEILSLRLQARKAQVERQYAVNQTMPSLSLYVYTEQNIGAREKDLGKDFRPFIAETSLLFDVPLQRRQARGRVVVAEAVLRQLALQTRLAADQIQADVREADATVQAAWGQVVRYREYEAQTRRLQQAESILLREGGSTTLLLNLREQSTSDARVSRIEAEAKYFGALAERRAALGLDAITPPEESTTPLSP